MSDFDVTTIPIFSRIGTLFVWVMLLNVLLAGAVIFLAFMARMLTRRINDLEQTIEQMKLSPDLDCEHKNTASDRTET
ncbi:MAG: hypothetical protein WCK47_11220 [bacterium]|nr:hypothetical protein [Candidatus Sumerlaeota bacterium]